jgi:hypothetical protein
MAGHEHHVLAPIAVEIEDAGAGASAALDVTLIGGLYSEYWPGSLISAQRPCDRRAKAIAGIECDADNVAGAAADPVKKAVGIDVEEERIAIA